MYCPNACSPLEKKSSHAEHVWHCPLCGANWFIIQTKTGQEIPPVPARENSLYMVSQYLHRIMTELDAHHAQFWVSHVFSAVLTVYPLNSRSFSRSYSPNILAAIRDENALIEDFIDEVKARR
ncbi:MAG: hypothetical protein KJ077_11200 [Anaerolineae bacterium]|nr:hypothetical protein [Anaerolineae bacterium]